MGKFLRAATTLVTIVAVSRIKRRTRGTSCLRCLRKHKVRSSADSNKNREDQDAYGNNILEDTIHEINLTLKPKYIGYPCRPST
jgi:hypothetical protein